MSHCLAAIAGAILGAFVAELWSAHNAKNALRQLAEDLSRELMTQVQAMQVSRMSGQDVEGEVFLCPVELAPTPVWESAVSGGDIAHFPPHTAATVALAFERISSFRAALGATPCLHASDERPSPWEASVPDSMWRPVERQQQQLAGAALAASLWAIARLNDSFSLEPPWASLTETLEPTLIDGPGGFNYMRFALETDEDLVDLAVFDSATRELRMLIVQLRTGPVGVLGGWHDQCYRWSKCGNNDRMYVCGGDCR
jgi:hypothetical protein